MSGSLLPCLAGSPAHSFSRTHPSPLAQGIMLVYDITNEKSFDNIRNWIRNIEEVRLKGNFHLASPQFSPWSPLVYR